MSGIKIGNIDIQFQKDWDSVKANQLVQSLQQVINAVRTLSNAQSTTPDNPTIAVHELADDAGLGKFHTVSGLVQGQVLIANAQDSVHFDFLHFEQIFKTDPVSFAAPAEGDVITYHDGFWSAIPSTSFSLTDPGVDAIAMWDTTADGGAGGLAWMVGGVGIKITSGRIAVDDTQLVHGHLLGLLADDHPQYALLAASNTWAFLQTFAAGIGVNGQLLLNGNLEQVGQEPEQFLQNTDDSPNEGSWRLHAEPGQLIFSSVSDDGSDGEDWLSITRILGIVDAVNVQSNSFTWNGDDVLTVALLKAGANVYLTKNSAGQLVINAANSVTGGSLAITDGTNNVTGVTSLTVTGGTVGGATPNATLTIAGGGGLSNLTPDLHASIPTGVGLGPNDEFEVGSSIDTAGTRYTGATAWTAFNLGTGSTSIGGGSLAFTPQVGAGVNYSGFVQPVPASGNWTYQAKIAASAVTSNQLLGLILATSAGAAGHLYLLGVNPTAIFSQRATNSTTFSANTTTGTLSGSASGTGLTIFTTQWIYLQIAWIAATSTFVFSMSQTGVPGSYTQILSETAATFLGTPGLIGIGAENQSSANAVELVDWFRRVA